MLYPKFIKQNEIIGISAPSAGIGRKLESFELSIYNLHKAGFQTYETEHVRLDNMRGGTAIQRANELTLLFQNPDIAMIMCAAGGDFLIEMLEHFDFTEVVNHPKWLMGASDPTSLLYPITTKYDIATLYGFNAGAFDQKELHPSLLLALDMIQGKPVIQTSYDAFEPISAKAGIGDYQLCEKVHWVNLSHCSSFQGRCIGGCLDALKDLFGTPYDGTKEFIERYKQDGIVWYFDIYSLPAETVYRTLLQMKSMGYFRYTTGILVGRVLFESSETGMNYQDAFQMIFNDIPVIMETDIGHTAPKMMMINGAMLYFEINEQDQGQLQFKFQ